MLSVFGAKNQEKRVIGRICRRLRKLAANRPFVFRSTARWVARRHLKRMQDFKGLTRKEISQMEGELGVIFPGLFREFLLRMGENPGELFRGSDYNPREFKKLRADAEDLIAESGASLRLTDRSVVFLFHQGYTFLYFQSYDLPDVPIYQYTEGQADSRKIAPSFQKLLESELDLMESVHRQMLEVGGYYLTIKDGSCTLSYPSVASGERPVDIGDRFD
jgi:SMI1/KNR4 family protein SUKH-1